MVDQPACQGVQCLRLSPKAKAETILQADISFRPPSFILRRISISTLPDAESAIRFTTRVPFELLELNTRMILRRPKRMSYEVVPATLL